MRSLLVGMVAIGLAGCATSPGTTSKNDPIEGFNREMLLFNLALDDAILNPASKVYTTVTPKFGRDRVTDFFSNLQEPVTIVNDLLQGQGERAIDSSGRFFINTTFGIAGLFDVASASGLEKHSEDFGQTLAVWGVDSGPYLVLPIIGPTNPRDLLGMGVDQAAKPTNYITYSGDDDGDLAIRSGLTILNTVNSRANAADDFATLKSQPEPYVALRRTYTSQRDAEIRNGQADPDAYDNLPDFDDFE